MKSHWWLKTAVFEYSIFPQLPSFCGVAACCCAAGCILNKRITQQALHAEYEIGLYTKLRAPASYKSEEFASLPRTGPGLSNWDIIRLFNSVMVDEGKQPWAALLCGADLVRETKERGHVEEILNWLRDDHCHAIVHTKNHYTLVAGAYDSSASRDIYLILMDSGMRRGPLRSLALAELRDLALRDDRYGFVLLSDKPLPPTLFRTWTDAMTPPEVTEQQRFARISAT